MLNRFWSRFCAWLEAGRIRKENYNPPPEVVYRSLVPPPGPPPKGGLSCGEPAVVIAPPKHQAVPTPTTPELIAQEIERLKQGCGHVYAATKEVAAEVMDLRGAWCVRCLQRIATFLATVPPMVSAPVDTQPTARIHDDDIQTLCQVLDRLAAYRQSAADDAIYYRGQAFLARLNGSAVPAPGRTKKT